MVAKTKLGWWAHDRQTTGYAKRSVGFEIRLDRLVHLF
jgi:hypothetical protein